MALDLTYAEMADKVRKTKRPTKATAIVITPALALLLSYVGNLPIRGY